MEEKKVHFSGNSAYTSCLVCGEGNADMHVLHELGDGHYYGGLSFHNRCFDVSLAIRERRKEWLTSGNQRVRSGSQ